MKRRSLSMATSVLALAVGANLSLADDRGTTTVTIYRAPAAAAYVQPNYGYYGGYGYGGYDAYGAATGDGAVITHTRQVELGKGLTELKFGGVASRLDPSTVQFKSFTDAKASAVEQRFENDLASVDALLDRYDGEVITVVTGHGEVKGTLRSWNDQVLVLEGADKSLQVLRRGDNIQDIRFAAPSTPLVDEPTLVWRIDAAKAGKHDVEVSYRAGGLAWNADYTAILDEKQNTLDLSAWATIRNQTGVDFDGAKVVLVSGALDVAPVAQPYPGYPQPARAASSKPWSYAVERPAHIADRGTLQLELFTPVVGAPAKRVTVYEPMPDSSASFTVYPSVECYSYYQPGSSTGRADVFLELAAGEERGGLPEGKVRLFKRTADGLELASEDWVKPNQTTHVARVRVAGDGDITGERRQIECRYDDRAKTLRERMEVKVKNKSKKATEVVLREYMYRWNNWSMEAEDVKGVKGSSSAQEYRLKIPAGGEETVTYTVLYSW
jgi:hypothetical protein